MTRALDKLNGADELEEEAPRAQEAKPVRPTEPVIPVPAVTPPSKLAAVIAAAASAKAERDASIAEKRERLDEALSNAEPARDELQSMADAMLEASANSPEAKAVSKAMTAVFAERQELERNVRQALGATIPELSAMTLSNIETSITNLLGTNAALSEAIRGICAAAGTIRIDEYVPVKGSNGHVTITRRWVDIGDEEPDQEPILETKWLLPAALKATARFAKLLQEVEEANKRAIQAAQQVAALTAAKLESEKERAIDKARLAHLEAIVKDIRPSVDGTPPGYYLRTSEGLWLAQNDADESCFITRWYMTKDQSEANSFYHRDNANEILLRLQMARVHRIGNRHRSTLKVVAIRYEDHTD